MTLFPIDSGWGCAGNDYDYDYIEIPLTSNRVANFEAEALRNVHIVYKSMPKCLGTS